MDSTLVAVTLISMSMAVVLSVIVWRMLREEGRRSAARVMALSQLAAAPRQKSVDLPLNRQLPTASVNLFAERNEPRSPWAGRLAVMACVALAGTALVFYALSSRQQHATIERQPTAAAASAAAPLELLSLHDSRDAMSLRVTGLVQNPATGAGLARVAVTALAFDEKGDFLASGRAMLDVTPLAPGDQSPFSVSVPITGDVARYRIGFRTDDGRVIDHVDRRGTADPEAGTGGSTFNE